jgi:hypothetical protein
MSWSTYLGIPHLQVSHFQDYDFNLVEKQAIVSLHLDVTRFPFLRLSTFKLVFRLFSLTGLEVGLLW